MKDKNVTKKWNCTIGRRIFKSKSFFLIYLEITKNSDICSAPQLFLIIIYPVHKKRIMASSDQDNRIAFATCIEIVLMRRGNVNYNTVLAKLQSLYKSWIYECVDHPEYLKSILKEVYVNDYYTIIEEIREESDRLEDIDKLKSDFFRIMLN